MVSYFSDFTDQKYTKTDFIRLLLKRIRKDLRQNNVLNLKKTYWLNESAIKTKLIQKILEEIFQGRLNLELKNKGAFENKLTGEYLEEYIENKLNVFFKEKPINNLTSKSISILRSITYIELKQLKEIYSIDGDLKKINNVFIEDMQKKYSQTKTSMLKSFINIEKIC